MEEPFCSVNLLDGKTKAMGKRKASWSERFVAALLCKGDLADEELDAEPCSTSKLFRFASRWEKFFFTIGILCAALSGVLMPLNTVFSGMVADVYLKAGNSAEGDDSVLDSVFVILYLYAGTAALQFIFSLIQQYLLLSATNSLVNKLRCEFVSAVLRTEASILDATSAGKMSSLLNENVDKVKDGLGEKIALVVRGMGMFLLSIGLSFFYNWKVTLCLVPLGPACAVVMGLMGKYTSSSLKEQMDSSTTAAAIVEESIMNVKTVAACNGQDDMVKRYSSFLSTSSRLGAKIGFTNGFFEGAFFFIIYLFSIVSLLIGVPDVHNGGAEAGSVIVAFGCILLGTYYLGTVGPFMMTLLKARIAAAVIYKTIDEATAREQVEEHVEKLGGSVIFENVHFKYPTRETPVLKGLSWRVESQQTIALAGHSGCGKSTIIGLLSKFYQKSDGQILVDGKDIGTIDKNILRRNIGVVSQEPCLFNGTIRENITLGRKWRGEGTEDERIKKVIDIAQAAHFIEKLEYGLFTKLGDGAISLSGGQKQRIAIARAIFMDPSILILDEATSALDVQSERKVQEALNEASIGRTTIMIAHRLSTLKNAHVIYVIDKGIVAEQGSHDYLISLGGLYARMAEKQSLCVEDEKKTKAKEDKPFNHSLERYSSRRSLLSDRAKSSDENERIISDSISKTSFLRLYTHGQTRQIWATVIIAALRGLEIPYYVVLMGILYAALNASPTDYWPLLIIYCVSSIFMGIAVWVTIAGAHYYSSLCSEGVMARVRERILSKILHRNAEYFDHKETSNATIVNDLNQHAGSLIAGLDHRMVLFVWCSSSFITCLLFSIVAKWQIGLMGLAASIVFFLLLAGLFYLMTIYMDNESRSSRTAENALEILEQVRTIQIMSVEGYFENKYEQAQREVKGLTRKVTIVQSLIYAFTQSSAFFFGLIAFAAGAEYVYNGELTPLNLYLIGISIEFCGCCLSFINPTFPDLMRANTAARILYTYFDLPDEIDAGDDKAELSGEFTVTNVNFAYPTRPEHKVANQLCISASSGESIALVGASGCGKSTLIGLIERFYEQSGGTIKVDGIDHRRISMHNLRSQIALVGQEPVLFQGSITENILLGCDGDLSLDDVRSACAMANASSFIQDLPQGYDTNVGSKGRSLSGGQKQRIAIARALVRKPKILLLDEATSALDGESERIVQEALERAAAGRTSISIAHRLSSIKDVSRIYFIEEGAVIECGNHEQLIDLNGKYASYVKAQSLDQN
ncbi:pgp-11 [Pristionchus pacificus]|uniref:ABC transporter ATP-binding protein n=1 Tax=Pristionchus pacificus TaxID=54126 RepID=A0A2A6C2W3_PRIPA|nr:pgp-11 [Pristionchus pacificus]|eukprot:PDM72572.1 ABC transporter ATP-binding protein [Pristionchus pacificus]